MTVAQGDDSTPTWRRIAVRVLVGTALFVAAGYLGRATMIGHHGLSLIWPAIGIAGLWIGSGDRRTWPTDLVALSASIVLVTSTTGADPPRVVIFLATNLVQEIGRAHV